jgi:molybdopterin synthase catalytic subunit
MRIRVLLFARYREAAGKPSIEVEVAEPATVGTVWDRVCAEVPALLGESRPLFACDRSYARPDRRIRGKEEIAAFPPVSGG